MGDIMETFRGLQDMHKHERAVFRRQMLGVCRATAEGIPQGAATESAVPHPQAPPSRPKAATQERGMDSGDER